MSELKADARLYSWSLETAAKPLSSLAGLTRHLCTNLRSKEYVQLMFNHYMTKSSDQLAEFLQVCASISSHFIA